MIDTSLQTATERMRALVIVKVAHTAIWAFFAGCILALPVAGWLRRFDWAAGLTAFVLIECLVLAVNRARCPLTAIARRYTDDRSPSFDIYLPEWLAAHNKTIFGTLFVINELIVYWQWRH
jgi:hypothetical protein